MYYGSTFSRSQFSAADYLVAVRIMGEEEWDQKTQPNQYQKK